MNAHQVEYETGHRRFTEQLGAYLDGELSQDDVSTLELHLRGCERLASHRGTADGTPAVDDVPPMRGSVRRQPQCQNLS